QLILRGALQGPSQGDASQIGIYEHGTIAIIPCKPQQSCLPGAKRFEASRKALHVGTGASGNGIKDIAYGRESRLDAGSLGMNAALHDSAHSGNEVGRARNS